MTNVVRLWAHAPIGHDTPPRRTTLRQGCYCGQHTHITLPIGTSYCPPNVHAWMRYHPPRCRLYASSWQRLVHVENEFRLFDLRAGAIWRWNWTICLLSSMKMVPQAMTVHFRYSGTTQARGHGSSVSVSTSTLYFTKVSDHCWLLQ